MDYNVVTTSGIQSTIKLVFVGAPILLGHSLCGATAGLVGASIFVLIATEYVLLTRTELGQVQRPAPEEIPEY